MTNCCSHVLRLSPETQPQQGLCCAPAPRGCHLPMAAASVPHPNLSYMLEIPLGAPPAPQHAGCWWGCSLDAPTPKALPCPKRQRDTHATSSSMAKQEHPRPCTQLGQSQNVKCHSTQLLSADQKIPVCILNEICGLCN